MGRFRLRDFEFRFPVREALDRMPGWAARATTSQTLIERRPGGPTITSVQSEFRALKKEKTPRTARAPAARGLCSTVPAPGPLPASPSAIPLNETPLDYMLRVMRDPNTDDERRDAMAKAALPYMHARLSSVDGHVSENQVSDNEGRAITFTWQPVQN